MSQRERHRINEVKAFLQPKDGKREFDILPILHNEDRVYLQFHGWSINLYADGTWIWEDTTGG